MLQVKQFLALCREHVRAGMLFVDQDDSPRLHAFCDDREKAVQIAEPAERADGDDDQVKLFPVPIINIIDIHRFKHTRQIQFLRFFIGKRHLVFGNVKANAFPALPLLTRESSSLPLLQQNWPITAPSVWSFFSTIFVSSLKNGSFVFFPATAGIKFDLPLKHVPLMRVQGHHAPGAGFMNRGGPCIVVFRLNNKAVNIIKHFYTLLSISPHGGKCGRYRAGGWRGNRPPNRRGRPRV